MKNVLLVAVGLALAPFFQSCSDGNSTPPSEASSSAAAPAASPAPVSSQAIAAQPIAAPDESTAPAPAVPPSQDPSNMRGGQRYQGGTENKLKTDYDLSKVKPNDTAVAADHSHDDGHDHGVPVQDGSQLTPTAQASQNKGRIELVEGGTQSQDLGKMRQGEKGSFDFPFLSAGEVPLIISGVKPSCGCTKAEIVLLQEDGTRTAYTKGEPIPVGQKFLLESEISTDGKPGGPFNAQISIYANDFRGAYNVRLTAEIEPVLTIAPSQSVFFGRMTTKDKAEQFVTVTSTRGEPFMLSVPQAVTQETLQVEYTAKNPDAEGKSNEWEVRVAMGPNCKIGMNSYPIQFKSDLPIAAPKYPSQDGSEQTHGFMLNVQAQVTGMVSAEPSFLTFGMVTPGEPVERSLRIVCHDDYQLQSEMPVTFEGLQGQEFPFGDSFSVTVVPSEEAGEADLKVTLSGLPEDLNGSFGGVLKVKVGHPYMDEISVRFSGVCRPGLPTAVGQPK